MFWKHVGHTPGLTAERAQSCPLSERGRKSAKRRSLICSFQGCVRCIHVSLSSPKTLLHLRFFRYLIERLLKISFDIIDIFNANRNPDQVWCYTAGFLLIFTQLLVCGG